MATERPRKSIYLDDFSEEMIREVAYNERISQSEVVRRAVNLYLGLSGTLAYKAASNLAQAKDLETSTVIEKAINKVVPEKYYD